MTPVQQISRVFTLIAGVGALLFFIAFGQCVVWSLDRTPPFEMLSYNALPARAGDNSIIKLDVRRDLARKCSVTYSRMFFDAKGARFEVTSGQQVMSAAAIEESNKRAPNTLRLSIMVPTKASPGVGALITTLDYACNPVHQLYPVQVLITMDIEVLP